MLVLFDFFKKYYKDYGKILVALTVSLTLIYWFIGNLPRIRSMYNCVNLKRMVTGEVTKCFDDKIGKTCEDTDIGHINGWCNDIENYGAIPGNKHGPYVGSCNNWTWDKANCPPSQCNGIETTKNHQQWGWCADKGIEHALRGAPCGPTGNVKCDDWIWNAKKCHLTCKTNKTIGANKTISSEESTECKTGLLCGMDENGNNKQCPPKDCNTNKTEQCKCDGPMEDPWKPYLNRPIRIRSKDKKYHLKINKVQKGGRKKHHKKHNKHNTHNTHNTDTDNETDNNEYGINTVDMGDMEELEEMDETDIGADKDTVHQSNNKKHHKKKHHKKKHHKKKHHNEKHHNEKHHNEKHSNKDVRFIESSDTNEGSSLLLESTDNGKYILSDSEGCQLNVNDNDNITFKCGDNTGNKYIPLIIEGTPGNFKMYVMREDKKQGLHMNESGGIHFTSNESTENLVVDMI